MRRILAVAVTVAMFLCGLPSVLGDRSTPPRDQSTWGALRTRNAGDIPARQPLIAEVSTPSSSNAWATELQQQQRAASSCSCEDVSASAPLQQLIRGPDEFELCAQGFRCVCAEGRVQRCNGFLWWLLGGRFDQDKQMCVGVFDCREFFYSHGTAKPTAKSTTAPKPTPPAESTPSVAEGPTPTAAPVDEPTESTAASESGGETPSSDTPWPPGTSTRRPSTPTRRPAATAEPSAGSRPPGGRLASMLLWMTIFLCILDAVLGL